MFKGTIFELISTSWPTIVIFLVIVILFRLFYYKNTSKRLILHEEILSIAFLVYVLLLFELVTSKEALTGGINLVPFKEILRYDVGTGGFYQQVLGNILLFVPFGFFASYYTKTKRLGSITLLTILVSLTIELVQKYIGRSFDIDDIILNLIGGIIGFLVYVGLDAIKNRMPRFLRSDAFLSFLSVVALVIIALYLFGLI